MVPDGSPSNLTRPIPTYVTKRFSLSRGLKMQRSLLTGLSASGDWVYPQRTGAPLGGVRLLGAAKAIATASARSGNRPRRPFRSSCASD